MSANEWIGKLNSFIIECKRVLTVTRKPTNTEFKNILKVSGLGIAIIGIIGFIIQMMRQLLQ